MPSRLRLENRNGWTGRTLDGPQQTPPIKNPPSGDGHHVTYRDMTPSELAEQEARQNAYERMLARQQAYADSLASPPQKPQAIAGCIFTKPCKLPNGVIDYLSPSGAIPTDAIKDYGELVLLGAVARMRREISRSRKSAVAPFPPRWATLRWVARGWRLPGLARQPAQL